MTTIIIINFFTSPIHGYIVHLVETWTAIGYRSDIHNATIEQQAHLGAKSCAVLMING
jgi:hypothetical protein